MSVMSQTMYISYKMAVSAAPSADSGQRQSEPPSRPSSQTMYSTYISNLAANKGERSETENNPQTETTDSSPSNMEDMEAAMKRLYEERKTKGTPLEQLKAHALSQGTHGIRLICRKFKKMDDGGDGDRRLQLDEFVNGFLASEELDMDKATLTALFHQIDETNRGNINFREFYDALKPPISDKRLAMIDKVFAKFDVSGDGKINIDDVRLSYSAESHPKVMSGEWTKEQAFDDWLSQLNPQDLTSIEKLDFLNYFIGVSASIDDDKQFEATMKKAWTML